MSTQRTHAIVIGASMAGLLTARVLSQHFAAVTLIERDAVRQGPASRKGQPQTRHLHGLLATGLATMSHYFPDLRQALVDHGAIINDMGETMVWTTYGGYRKPFKSGIHSAIMSRPLLEHLIRERVLALPNVTLLDETDVEKLEVDGKGKQVTGLVFNRNAVAGQQLAADLVVDCSGRGSRMPKWLAALNFTPPGESEVTVNVGYATRIYRRDPADPRRHNWYLSTPEAPKETRFGGCFPIEGDRWIVSIGGWEGDHAPIEAAGFQEYARQLPNPDIYDVVSKCEPLSEVMPYKFKSSLRRHYEKLAHFPEGLLVLGDAICSFNPTYGQGMTSAALQAKALDGVLQSSSGLQGIAPRFFKRAAAIVDVPWQLAVGEDFRFPHTTGPKPAGVDFINHYVAMVHRATLSDAEVGKAFLNVMNLAAAPTSLFHPRILWRVLKAGRAQTTPAQVQAVGELAHN
jgi:2-polyprenyl-6-methoxyphenol hydroxylase-like FAD-dependent oxidoreductase